MIGQHGDRQQCIAKYEEHVRANSSLMERLEELGGKVLMCHCGEHEPCHGDVLLALWQEAHDGIGSADEATSDEDIFGQAKAKHGAGWRGTGMPLFVGHGARRKELRDGGGLCSTGRWPPERRCLPASGVELANVLKDFIVDYEKSREEGFWRRLVCALACGRVDTDPILDLAPRSKAVLETFLMAKGFARDGRQLHPSAVIDFELMEGLARHLQDPDHAILRLYSSGVFIGWGQRMPRTPAVFERKHKWKKHVGDRSEGVEWASNYKSASLRPDILLKTFEEHEKAGMMYRCTYKEARERFGDRLRVAAQCAIEQGQDEWRVVHDATNKVHVNNRIRVRDQEANPCVSDLVVVLDKEYEDYDGTLFVLAFDVSKAHRRVPVVEDDWGLMCCSTLPSTEDPHDDTEVWVNKVGTYGVGSASYWFGRLGALVTRLILYVVSAQGLRWLLRFVDDFLAIARGGHRWQPMALILVLLQAMDVPLKWSKFRGGFKAGWIGYMVDLDLREAGLSRRRSDWAASWCSRLAEAEYVQIQEFREGLGRLGFAAELFLFTKPLLGPLYSWCAVMDAEVSVQPPPMVKLVLSWLAECFRKREQVKLGVPTRHIGERYRADAKAEGDRVVLGGWELCGREGTAGCRWFSVGLSRAQIPWAYTRGDPFRSIAALELMATLLCILAFNPLECHLTGVRISLTAATDNQSNGFLLDKMASTKYPVYLVLMEVAEQLRRRNLALSVAWRPREENEEADALTNGAFVGFDPGRRVSIVWRDLPLLVLPKYTAEAEKLFLLMKEYKAGDKRPLSVGVPMKAKGGGLRETDPW